MKLHSLILTIYWIVALVLEKETKLSGRTVAA
jgi:hypothetical protein